MSIGFDFGTLLNRIGCFNHIGFKIITNDLRNSATPSVAFINHKDQWFFGESGVKLALDKPNKCIRELKLMLGRKFDNEIIQSNLKYWKFNIKKDANENIQIEIPGSEKSQNIYPYKIFGKILANLIEISKSRLPKPIHKTIISIPAGFDKNQINDLKKAVKLSDMQNVNYVIEPILASIAYFYNSNLNPTDDRIILVYSFGFSNPESTIIKIHNETYEITTQIDKKINGHQFDENIFNFINDKMKEKYPTKINFIERPKTQTKLRFACEKAKIFLSEKKYHNIFIKDDENDKEEEEEKESLSVRITYEEFNEINKDLFEHSMESVKTVITESKIGEKNIDFLFLVGGMTKMKKIRENLKDMTGKDPQAFVDPCEAPTLGACILGASLLMKESPEIMFLRNNQFFDNLRIFENALLSGDLEEKSESTGGDAENIPLVCEVANDEEKENLEKEEESRVESSNLAKEEEAAKKEESKTSENIEELNSSLILINEEVERLTKTLDDITDEMRKKPELEKSTATGRKTALTEDDEQVKAADHLAPLKEPVSVNGEGKGTVDDSKREAEDETASKKEVKQEEETVYYVTPIIDIAALKEEKEKVADKSQYEEEEEEDSYEEDGNGAKKVEFDGSSEKVEYDASSEKVEFDASSEKVEFDVSSEKVEFDASSEKVEFDVSSEKVEYDVSSEKVEYDVSSEKVEYDVSSEKVEFDVSSEKVDVINENMKSILLEEEEERVEDSAEASGVFIVEDEICKKKEDDPIDNGQAGLALSLPFKDQIKLHIQKNKTKVFSIATNILDKVDYIIIVGVFVLLVCYAYNENIVNGDFQIAKINSKKNFS